MSHTDSEWMARVVETMMAVTYDRDTYCDSAQTVPHAIEAYKLFRTLMEAYLMVN